MNCYVCEYDAQIPTPAVAICKNCGVALCMTHLAEMQANRPGGTEMGCPHVLPTPKDVGTTAQTG